MLQLRPGSDRQSVSQIQKKTKEERTTKKLHEVEEINTHGLDNKDKPDHVDRDLSLGGQVLPGADLQLRRAADVRVHRSGAGSFPGIRADAPAAERHRPAGAPPAELTHKDHYRQLPDVHPGLHGAGLLTATAPIQRRQRRWRREGKIENANARRRQRILSRPRDTRSRASASVCRSFMRIPRGEAGVRRRALLLVVYQQHRPPAPRRGVLDLAARLSWAGWDRPFPWPSTAMT